MVLIQNDLCGGDLSGGRGAGWSENKPGASRWQVPSGSGKDTLGKSLPGGLPPFPWRSNSLGITQSLQGLAGLKVERRGSFRLGGNMGQPEQVDAMA